MTELQQLHSLNILYSLLECKLKIWAYRYHWLCHTHILVSIAALRCIPLCLWFWTKLHKDSLRGSLHLAHHAHIKSLYTPAAEHISTGMHSQINAKCVAVTYFGKVKSQETDKSSGRSKDTAYGVERAAEPASETYDHQPSSLLQQSIDANLQSICQVAYFNLIQWVNMKLD